MTMLYIASGLPNKERVIELRDKLAAHGIPLTYDWTLHGRVTDPQALIDISIGESDGVKNAKCLLVVLPGGKGTHVELGIAHALNIPIAILNEDKDYVLVSFHFLPGIIRFVEEQEAIDWVLGILKE